jgi:hypothetical protein
MTKDELVIALGETLAEACRKEFGTEWCNDVRWAFARAVLAKLDDLGCSERDILGLIDGDLTTCDGYCHEFCGASE